QLQERLANNDPNTVVIDTRFELTKPEVGRQVYKEGHIPTAVHFDLNEDLSSAPGKHGGGHPLPNTEEFASKLGAAGIDQDTTVVIYDDANDMYAARAWWLLHYYGLENVYLLDGGLKEWLAKGNELSTEIPTPTAKEITLKPN